jgi:hypothetical protein
MSTTRKRRKRGRAARIGKRKLRRKQNPRFQRLLKNKNVLIENPVCIEAHGISRSLFVRILLFDERITAISLEFKGIRIEIIDDLAHIVNAVAEDREVLGDHVALNDKASFARDVYRCRIAVADLFNAFAHCSHLFFTCTGPMVAAADSVKLVVRDKMILAELLCTFKIVVHMAYGDSFVGISVSDK